MPDSFESFAPASGGFCSDCFSNFSSTLYAPGGSNFFSGADSSLAVPPSISRASDTLPLNTASLYGSDKVSAPNSFDSSKSIQQHLSDGNFKQSSKPAPEHTELKDKQQPQITVSKDTGKPADFTIKADGSVEVHGNPENSGKRPSEYKIAVEPGADQKVTEGLVNYLKDRLEKSGDNVKPTLNAESGLVSEDVRKSFEPPEDIDDKDDPDKDQIDDQDRNNNGGGGNNNNGGRDDNGRDLEDDKDGGKDDITDDPKDDKKVESVSSLEALKQSLIASTDASGNPNWENGTAGSLGAYSMDAVPWFASYMTSEMLDELEEIDPKTGKKVINWKKLGKVMAKHANDPKFQKLMQGHVDSMKGQGDDQSASTMQSLIDRLQKDSNFADGFGAFLQNQQERKNATPEEMKNFFSKDVQQAALSSQMSDLATKLDIKLKDMNEKQAGDLALAMTMGSNAAAMDKQALQAEMDKLRKDPLYANYIQETIAKFLRNKRASKK